MSSREVTAHVRALEGSIAKLAAERQRIDDELLVLMAMLAVSEPKPRDGRRRKHKPAEVALARLTSQQELTAKQLSKDAGVSMALAAGTLNRLVRLKKARRIRRGVYGRANP